MKDFTETIPIRCIFCKSTSFIVPSKDFKPYHGVLLVCNNCGRENDYTSLFISLKVKAIDRAKTIVTKMAEDEMKKMLKKLKF